MLPQKTRHAFLLYRHQQSAIDGRLRSSMGEMPDFVGVWSNIVG
jgi:hypothetical protein